MCGLVVNWLELACITKQYNLVLLLLLLLLVHYYWPARAVFLWCSGRCDSKERNLIGTDKDLKRDAVDKYMDITQKIRLQWIKYWKTTNRPAGGAQPPAARLLVFHSACSGKYISPFRIWVYPTQCLLSSWWREIGACLQYYLYFSRLIILATVSRPM